MIRFIQAENISDIKIIVQLAQLIWHEHYTAIIGSKQVVYMLKKFQSETAIKLQIAQGFEYYLIVKNDKPVGYISFKKDNETLFLSKIYLLSQYRAQKIGNQAMNFIEKKAHEMDCKKITLTVNKYNTNTLQIYEKMGFKIIDSVIKDIGNKFIMDDYVMEKNIQN